MNIQEAKDSVKDAIGTYLGRNAAGLFRVSRSRQRPIMLMGPPGLGKTAIVSQIAAEMKIGFVSYTITHHTRQSAIGLPTISTRIFDGKECILTEYTMSEIIASVHDAIEKQGHREGILFIDEINCVSETLAPAMLDLLQNKRFGPHAIPDGWILVAACNPPEFNSSARMFDIATMDRIRFIDVEPDTDVWLNYAVNNGVHGAITYYLRIKPQNLLRIERTVGGYSFATPRAWEDLSVILTEYDRSGIEADSALISQYIRDPEIASEFSRYLKFYRRYNDAHNVTDMLENGNPGNLGDSSPEEKMSVISVMIGRINSVASMCSDLRALDDMLSDNPDKGVLAEELGRKLNGNITASERRAITFALEEIQKDGSSANGRLDSNLCVMNRYISNAMKSLISEFGNGQEPVSLLVGLLGCRDVVMMSSPDGPLYEYNDVLLVSKRVMIS